MAPDRESNYGDNVMLTVNNLPRIRVFICSCATLYVAWTVSGCSTPPQTVPVTNSRPPTQTLPGAMLHQITVEDMRATADVMARDLILQPFITNASKPPIVAVKPLENKTDLTVDPDIFQKTIRVKLMSRAGGRILFRDETSRAHTIDERMKQRGKVQIESTTTNQIITPPTRVGQPLPPVMSSQNRTDMRSDATVETKVADIDYFLTGLIFSTKEVVTVNAPQGMRYFQFQFRVTDARNNIIVWEKEYLVKRQGIFQ